MKKRFYGMRNDYMFRAVMQKSQAALKSLLCALLRLDEAEIISADIMNAIALGEAVSEKDCILDIKVELNRDRIIDIELQIQYQSFWPERSLLYWARSFNELESGKEYDKLRETCHIGILAFTLFPKEPEFYAEYRIQNCRTQRRYTDKFCIRVLDLTKMDLADQEKEKDILQWAQMIQADSTEMLDYCAGEKEVFKEMAELIKMLNNDKKIRQQCEARFFYECDMASMRAEGKKEGLAEGRAEGREEGQAQIIYMLYQKGYSPEQIAKDTDRQVEEIYKIIRENMCAEA